MLLEESIEMRSITGWVSRPARSSLCSCNVGAKFCSRRRVAERPCAAVIIRHGMSSQRPLTGSWTEHMHARACKAPCCSSLEMLNVKLIMHS